MEGSVPIVDGKAIVVIGSSDDGVGFSSPLLDNILVQLYAPLNTHSSMSNVAAQLFRELKNTQDAIGLHNYFGSEGWAEPDLEYYSGIDPKAPIGLFLGVPQRVPETFFRHEITIGAFVCETDRIPDHWVYCCNRFDLILVPSRFCLDAFANSGVQVPIMVVPHGLEPAYRPYSEKKRANKLVFFNSFFSASLSYRKSLEELIRSFLKAFAGRTDVVLRLRTDHSSALKDCQNKYNFDGLIELDIITSTTSTENYARIFSDVHCTVHPSKGEGFGLVPFQSIACETPVIAPHSTGMADYLNENNSLILKTGELVPPNEDNQVGHFNAVDEDHLVKQLQYMRANWESEYRKVQKVSAQFRTENSWTNALLNLTELITELVECDEILDRKYYLEKYCKSLLNE